MRTTEANKVGRKSQASPKAVAKVRKIRFASAEQSKTAGDWAVKKYDEVFRRLSQ